MLALSCYSSASLNASSLKASPPPSPSTLPPSCLPRDQATSLPGGDNASPSVSCVAGLPRGNPHCGDASPFGSLSRATQLLRATCQHALVETWTILSQIFSRHRSLSEVFLLLEEIAEVSGVTFLPLDK